MVLHRYERQVDAGHPPDLASPESRGIDDVLADDISLIGDHAPIGCLAYQVKNAGVTVDLRTLNPCSLRKRVCGSVRVEMSFFRRKESATHSRGVDDRAQLRNVGRREQLRRQPQYLVSRPVRAQRIPPCARLGNEQPAREVHPDILARDRLDLLVERDRVGLQACNACVAVECVEAAGGVPARSGGQLLAFAQHDVGPAHLRQVIQHTAPDHASSDNDDPCVRLHEEFPRSACVPRKYHEMKTAHCASCVE